MAQKYKLKSEAIIVGTTAMPLSAYSQMALFGVVQATDDAYIGGADVTVDNGVKIPAGTNFPLSSLPNFGLNGWDLTGIYLIAAADDQDARVVYAVES